MYESLSSSLSPLCGILTLLKRFLSAWTNSETPVFETIILSNSPVNTVCIWSNSGPQEEIQAGNYVNFMLSPEHQ